MINRIVRLSFEPKLVSDFLAVFENSKNHIANFPGCQGLTLLQDLTDSNVYYTYSLWLDESDLEKYRHSELFEITWAATKKLFNAKPMAFSATVNQIIK